MEKAQDLRLPNQLCQKIFNNQFQIDIGNVNQQIITQTIQLYVQAMQFFANQISMYAESPDFDLALTQKKHNYYQQKIKKLLSKNQVDNCLIGKKTDKKTLDFQKQLNKIHQNAPQQAKLLIQHFKNHHKNQQNLINQNINKQQQKLNQRLRRRSSSVRKPQPAKLVQKENNASGIKVLNSKLFGLA